LCRWYDLDWLVNAAKRLGFRQAFGMSGRIPSMASDTRAQLDKLFQPEIAELEGLLGLSLDVWRHRTVSERTVAPDKVTV
jgi:hypothetical protein